MEQTSRKVAVALMVMKLIVTVLIFVFYEYFGIGFPFVLFAPLFLMAVAFGGISKTMAIAMLVAIVAMTGILVICPVLLLITKRRTNVVATILQILFFIDGLCFLLSLFAAGFFRKMIGLILDIIIISLLSEIKQSEKIRRMAQGED